MANISIKITYLSSSSRKLFLIETLQFLSYRISYPASPFLSNMHFNIALASTFVVNASAFIIGTERAPLIGPSFATNFDHFTSKPLEDAKTEFSSRLEQLFSTEKLNRTDLVFAVDVFSANTNSSIYSKFHVGEGQEKILTAGELNSDTIGRLGSVSKLVTAYGLIAEAGIEVFSHPVTRYFPELRSNSTVPNRIKWEEITVGALASHQAGTGGVGGMFIFSTRIRDTCPVYTNTSTIDYFRKVQSGTEMTVDCKSIRTYQTKMKC
jgi:CubicO group peptidase (beta-lactamase class C family)